MKLQLFVCIYISPSRLYVLTQIYINELFNEYLLYKFFSFSGSKFGLKTSLRINFYQIEFNLKSI